MGHFWIGLGVLIALLWPPFGTYTVIHSWWLRCEDLKEGLEAGEVEMGRMAGNLEVPIQ